MWSVTRIGLNNFELSIWICKTDGGPKLLVLGKEKGFD